MARHSPATAGALGGSEHYLLTDAIMLLAYPAMTGVLHRAGVQQPPSGFNPERLPAVAGVGTATGRPGEFAELGGRPPLPGDVYEDSYYRSRCSRGRS